MLIDCVHMYIRAYVHDTCTHTIMFTMHHTLLATSVLGNSFICAKCILFSIIRKVYNILTKTLTLEEKACWTDMPQDTWGEHYIYIYIYIYIQ